VIITYKGVEVKIENPTVAGRAWEVVTKLLNEGTTENTPVSTRKPYTKRKHRRYTSEEKEILKTMVKENRSVSAIATKLHRPKEAVAQKVYLLKRSGFVSEPTPQPEPAQSSPYTVSHSV
jgi:hypothetical protein